MSAQMTWQHVAIVAIVVGALVALAVEHLITGGQALLGIGVVTGVGATLIGVSAGATTSLNATTTARESKTP